MLYVTVVIPNIFCTPVPATLQGKLQCFRFKRTPVLIGSKQLSCSQFYNQSFKQTYKLFWA